MTTINQDDALGTGAEDYSDEQGVFPKGRPGTRAPAVVEAGGGRAKLFLIVFIVLLLSALGWVGWKVVQRGESAVDAETLSLPVAEADALPMTGAPINEEPAAALAPVEPAAMAPAMPQEPAAGGVAPAPVAVEPAADPAPVPAPVGVGAAPSAAPTPSAAPAPAPVSPPAGADDVTALREQLRMAQARIAELEKAPTPTGAGAGDRPVQKPTPKRSAAAAPKTRSAPASRQAPAVASTERKSSAKPAPTPNGVVLKAVLEGRVWLQLGSGETVTAAPGDDVAGVGTVSSIDAERGEVHFANGAVLK